MKPIISVYSQRAPYKIYTHDEWWADDWDAKIYGRPFDFTRPFFEQFKELLLSVPRVAIMNTQSENCEYANFVLKSKNCYLVFGCVEDEDCAYGHIVWESKDSIDNLYLYKSELCYESIDCLGSYKLFYCQECENCTESIGLFDCRGCANCIGCVGLSQKSHYIFNEPVGREAYEAFLKEHPLTDAATIALILQKQAELRKKVPQRFFFGSKNSDVSGNHIYNARDVHASFDIKRGEHARYAYTGKDVVETYDASFCGARTERECEVLTSHGKDIYFSHMCTNCTDVYYSDACSNAHNIFGCAGLKGGEYCILNQEYPKEEYVALKEKIIAHMKRTGEWGEFFPASLSPFSYNESIVQEYMPLEKEEALAQGFRWTDDLPSTVGLETIAYADLPKDPQTFTDDLLKHILKCGTCGRNYRLIPSELSFYRRMQLPLPPHCFNCRHAARMRKRNVRELWPGTCAKCGTAFRTSYNEAQQKEFKIYCESCYQSEMG